MSAKWPGLPAFLAHLAIGACLAMPVNTFVQYYFNGRLMAQLPQWDASIYSHAVIMPMDVLGVRFTALLCTTEPFTVTADGYLQLQNPATAILATGVIANRVHVRWKWLDGTNDYDAGVWKTSAAAVIWSNYDLVDSSGTVYLAASEPVPRVKREPVAYLYNGLRLPAFTESIAAQPYKFIHTDNYGDMHVVGLTRQPVTYHNLLDYYGLADNPTSGFVRQYSDYDAATGIGSEWKDHPLPTLMGASAQLETVKWSNTDVYDLGGNLILAASDPVPVYE